MEIPVFYLSVCPSPINNQVGAQSWSLMQSHLHLEHICHTSVTPTAHLTMVFQLSYMSCSTLTYFSVTPDFLIQHQSSSQHPVICFLRVYKDTIQVPLTFSELLYQHLQKQILRQQYSLILQSYALQSTVFEKWCVFSWWLLQVGCNTDKYRRSFLPTFLMYYNDYNMTILWTDRCSHL